MNEKEVLNQMSQASIDLAEAAANYGALKVIFGVFMVIIFLMLISFFYVGVMAIKKFSKVSDAADKTLSYFNNLSDRKVGLDEARVLLRATTNDLSVYTKYNILRIRLENNISDEEATKLKITRMLDNLFAEINQFLHNFDYKGRNLSEIVNLSADESTIFNLIWEQVYGNKDSFKVSSMDNTVELVFQGIKLKYIKKLEV